MHWCPVPEIRGILPAVSWLFFKARAKRPYLSHTGRASNAEKQPTGHGPKGCDENGPAAALLVGHVSIQICSLLTPCRRPILIATIYLYFGDRTLVLVYRLLASRLTRTAAPRSGRARQLCPPDIAQSPPRSRSRPTPRQSPNQRGKLWKPGARLLTRFRPRRLE